MRSLQLSFRNSRTRAFTSRWRAPLWICTREWDMLARRKLRFCSYQFENIGRKLRRSEDAGTSLALSTTVLTWLVRAPMAKSISSVDAMSLGMLLSECDIYRRGSMCDDMGKHVDVEGAMIPKSSLSSFVEFNSVIIVRWAAPSYVLQLKSPKRMTASPKAKGLLGRAGATVLETGDRPRL
ncbi:hypothetical protein EVAR_40701_1 [Eumeta japonica]|uniref:Uncharacterized protein n=1 Tax=Eumeta variegata TaxID=151549 RepID=A0A4C1X680_EUMVA|nr:hypothetical protein EVAR_40701_1 [Eumeta japonica]